MIEEESASGLEIEHGLSNSTPPYNLEQQMLQDLGNQVDAENQGPPSGFEVLAFAANKGPQSGQGNNEIQVPQGASAQQVRNTETQ